MDESSLVKTKSIRDKIRDRPETVEDSEIESIRRWE